MKLLSRSRPVLGRFTLLVLVLLCPFDGMAQKQDASEAGRAADDEAQFMLMLEFIGEFTDEEGNWTDPIELEQEPGIDEVSRNDAINNNGSADSASTDVTTRL